jgi:hypothetical protein
MRYGMKELFRSESGSVALATPTFTMWYASGIGGLRRTSPYRRVKIAVLAPMPSVKVRTAVSERIGFLPRDRNPCTLS